jgi:predicted nucleotidyltransferase
MMPSLDASTAVDLEPAARVLAEVQHQADLRGVRIMVVGAVARDILITHVIGSPPARATADIDVAVAVESWADFSALTESLTRASKSEHTFVVLGTDVDYRMDVFGFREALSGAVEVKLPGGLVVAVASLPAQSVLKILAWRDRHHDDRRDAVDLRTILLTYQDGPYVDELYTNHEDLLAQHDFDLPAAAAERMGREASALIAPKDRSTVTDLLRSEKFVNDLAGDMGGLPTVNLSLISAYRTGFDSDPAAKS